MSMLAANAFAHLCRTFPVEKGRWRIGSIAERLLDGQDVGSVTKTVRTRHGFSMNLRLSEFVDRTIYCTGEWEPLESEIIVRRLRPGDSFVDVGANIGYFSLLARRIAGPTGRVHAIEASAATFARLEANIALNAFRGIETYQVAVGDEPGVARISSREEGNCGGDFALFGKNQAIDGGDVVQVVRLDDLIRDPGVRIVKMDIEGAEAKALRGASAILSGPQAPDVIFELTPRLLEFNGDDADETIEFVRSLGYGVHTIGNSGLSPVRGSLARVEQAYVFCTKSAL